MKTKMNLVLILVAITTFVMAYTIDTSKKLEIGSIINQTSDTEITIKGEIRDRSLKLVKISKDEIMEVKEVPVEKIAYCVLQPIVRCKHPIPVLTPIPPKSTPTVIDVPSIEINLADIKLPSVELAENSQE